MKPLIIGHHADHAMKHGMKIVVCHACAKYIRFGCCSGIARSRGLLGTIVIVRLAYESCVALKMQLPIVTRYNRIDSLAGMEIGDLTFSKEIDMMVLPKFTLPDMVNTKLVEALEQVPWT